MFKKWWGSRQEEHALQEQKDAADADLSDAQKLPPIFKNTDWTGGGPL